MTARTYQTQVCIIGAGPAGLLLGHLLRAQGVACVALDRRSAAHILSRIRAGVLETGTVEMVEGLGLGTRMAAEGLWHDGFMLSMGQRRLRIDLAELTGRRVMVYGQTELTRDLMEAANERDLEVIYDAEDVSLHEVAGDRPFVTYRKDGQDCLINCTFIAGCDGFHGPSRKAILGHGKEYERTYPFGWLGILADVPPCTEELIYASYNRGFALASMRSRTRSRYYIDVPTSERLEAWPDERIWDELEERLGEKGTGRLVRGDAIEKSIAPLRSYVFAPMRHGNLLLCGDAAHIVPPTGAKGLNLAASDVHYAARALAAYFLHRDTDAIAAYSRQALARVWKAERFSWSLTRLLHRFDSDTSFDRAMQEAEFDYLSTSRAAQTAIAENYAGLPL